jgi:hypothetical protein
MARCVCNFGAAVTIEEGTVYIVHLCDLGISLTRIFYCRISYHGLKSNLSFSLRLISSPPSSPTHTLDQSSSSCPPSATRRPRRTLPRRRRPPSHPSRRRIQPPPHLRSFVGAAMTSLPDPGPTAFPCRPVGGALAARHHHRLGPPSMPGGYSSPPSNPEP